MPRLVHRGENKRENKDRLHVDLNERATVTLFSRCWTAELSFDICSSVLHRTCRNSVTVEKGITGDVSRHNVILCCTVTRLHQDVFKVSRLNVGDIARVHQSVVGSGHWRETIALGKTLIRHCLLSHSSYMDFQRTFKHWHLGTWLILERTDYRSSLAKKMRVLVLFRAILSFREFFFIMNCWTCYK